MNENNKTRCRFGFDGNMKDVKPEAKKVVAGIEIFYPIQHKELLTHLIEKSNCSYRTLVPNTV